MPILITIALWLLAIAFLYFASIFIWNLSKLAWKKWGERRQRIHEEQEQFLAKIETSYEKSSRNERDCERLCDQVKSIRAEIEKIKMELLKGQATAMLPNQSVTADMQTSA